MVYLTGKKFFLESKAIRVTKAIRAMKDHGVCKDFKDRGVSKEYRVQTERMAQHHTFTSSIRQ